MMKTNAKLVLWVWATHLATFHCHGSGGENDGNENRDGGDDSDNEDDGVL